MPSLLPDDPASPTRHEAAQTTAQGPHGGPSWRYRGSLILSNPKGTQFALEDQPEGLPGRWRGLGNRQEIQRVIDAWIDTGRLPQGYLMPGEKAGAAGGKG